MKDWKRPFLIRFVGGMVGYAILLVAALLAVGSKWVVNTAVSVIVILFPMLPLLYAMTAVVNNIRQQDELIQHIHLESILITALLTGGLTFSYGLLEAAELVPSLPMVIVAPSMILIWGITNNLISRRYR